MSSPRRPASVALDVAFAGDVGEEDEPGLVTEADLLHRADRDAVLAEDRRHRAEDAGPVEHVDGQVLGAPQLVDRPDRHPSARAPCGRDHLRSGGSPHRSGRRAPPTPSAVLRRRAVEHQLAAALALDEDRVERPAHRCERMLARDHRRVDPDRDLGDGSSPARRESVRSATASSFTT